LKHQKFSSVTASIPASSANLGPGFDVHSIALQSPKLKLEVALRPEGTRIIELGGTYKNDSTSDPNVNAAGKALDNLLSLFEKSVGYQVKIDVEIPPRKGLGLSGAESVGAVVCANRLLKLGLDGRRIVEMAGAAEPSQHMDNVSASGLGGFNIAYLNPINKQVQFTTLMPPTDLGVAIIVPNIEKKSTAETRRLIPSTVTKANYIASMSYVSVISASFAQKDVESILATLPWDFVIEAARADGGAYGDGVTSSFLQEEKQVLEERYHVAETISGAGPSRALWFSIRQDAKTKKRNRLGLIKPAVEFVSERFEALGHKAQQVYITKPSKTGAVIV